jgi:hypothetical protein
MRFCSRKFDKQRAQHVVDFVFETDRFSRVFSELFGDAIKVVDQVREHGQRVLGLCRALLQQFPLGAEHASLRSEHVLCNPESLLHQTLHEFDRGIKQQLQSRKNQNISSHITQSSRETRAVPFHSKHRRRASLLLTSTACTS